MTDWIMAIIITIGAAAGISILLWMFFSIISYLAWGCWHSEKP